MIRDVKEIACAVASEWASDDFDPVKFKAALDQLEWTTRPYRAHVHTRPEIDARFWKTREELESDICSCGLPYELCTAIAMFDIMCVAATRGEVANAQHAAARFLEHLS